MPAAGPAQGTASASTTPSASPSAPAVPVLNPDGSAEDNLPYFTALVQPVWAGPDTAAGRAYIDALVAGGFDRAAMQVTADLTTIGNPVERIEFSVRWGEDCLVGQVGPEIGELVTTVMPGLSDGRCLVGKTRPIDW